MATPRLLATLLLCVWVTCMKVLADSEVPSSGVFSVSNARLAVIDSDTGSPESEQKLDFGSRSTATLAANHLQKLLLRFELISPRGAPFTPQQAFLKLRHESNVEHLFLIKSTGKLLELKLDFLGLVERFHYLSGIYTLELIVGDVAMENSFLWVLGSLDLDLPDAPEGATGPTAAVNYSLKYGQKPEIEHIFRAPEKRPPLQLSYAFLVLTLLPLLAFLSGLIALGVNLKSFPSGGLPLLAAVGFNAGIGLILGLYFLFWLKLDLFSTLKALGFLGLFTAVTGHIILSHLADSAYKVKSS